MPKKDFQIDSFVSLRLKVTNWTVIWHLDDFVEMGQGHIYIGHQGDFCTVPCSVTHFPAVNFPNITKNKITFSIQINIFNWGSHFHQYTIWKTLFEESFSDMKVGNLNSLCWQLFSSISFINSIFDCELLIDNLTCCF